MTIEERPTLPPVPASDDAPPDGPTASTGQRGPIKPLEEHGLYRFGILYGRLIHRLRWVVIALWAVALVASVPFVTQLGSVLTGGGYNFAHSESAQANDLMTQRLHLPASQLLVVFQSKTTAAVDPTYQNEITTFVQNAQSFAHVTGVTVAPPGKDGRTELVTVSFNAGANTVESNLGNFSKLIPSSGPATAYVTGNPAIYHEFTTLTQQDVEKAERYALPIALLVLIVVFGSLLAAAMPILLAVVAVPIALAVIYAIAVHTTTSVFVLNIATIVGLGISIDYSLFMVRRFRDELARHTDISEAIGWTVATAGEAIFFSGLTVMVGFCGLLLINVSFMTSLGIGGAVVVFVAVLAALTLLPAILAVLGTRVNSLRVPLLSRLTIPHPEDEQREGFWGRLANFVMRRAWLVVAAVVVILLLLASPLLAINIGTPGVSELPASAPTRQGLELVYAQYPQMAQNTDLVVLRTRNGSNILTVSNLQMVLRMQEVAAQQPHVTGVTSVLTVPQSATAPAASASPSSPALTPAQLIQLFASSDYTQNPGLAQLVHSTTRGDLTVISVGTNAKIDSSASKQLVTDLRTQLKAQASGMQVYVGGFQASSLDFNNYLYGHFPTAILFIMVAAFLLLMLMFRSVVLPLKAVLMNALSVTAAYGVLVFVFQQGHFSNLLNFTSTGTIDSTNPILLFCILFGLSMDYEVFLLSRIREEWLSTHNNRYAVARGLEKTGGVITSAALLFIIVAGSFVFTNLIVTKEMGLGMAIAIFVDASIVRILLVPATMRLIGRWNWWFPGSPLPKDVG